jgi:hypothetical protein
MTLRTWFPPPTEEEDQQMIRALLWHMAILSVLTVILGAASALWFPSMLLESLCVGGLPLGLLAIWLLTLLIVREK